MLNIAKFLPSVQFYFVLLDDNIHEEDQGKHHNKIHSLQYDPKTKKNNRGKSKQTNKLNKIDRPYE